MTTIDLRSDTVTMPSAAMRNAMAHAEVGDDVYGEDPTINRLEQTAAALVGQAAGLLVPSGTQSNLAAILSHCQRGDEYIVGQQAHTYRYEAGGAAVLGSIQPQPLEFESDGSLPLERIVAAIKPADIHFPNTKLVCLENTQAGKVLPLDYQRQAVTLAHDHGLRIHLDGARLFNAAVKLGVSPATIGGLYDSVSICLSKGLGSPVGAGVGGAQALNTEARRWRKMLGGGMRQAGVLAAAGLYALEHNIDRLAEDHANAKALADGLAEIPALADKLDPTSAETNMVFVDMGHETATELASYLDAEAVRITPAARVRLVTHLDIHQSAIDKVVSLCGRFFSNRR